MSITPHALDDAGPPRINAAIYVRMSTEHQQYSTDNQKAKIYEYAAQRHFDVIETYADEGKSGLNIKGRRGLQRLVKDVQSGTADFKIILVYDVSRWGRFQDADESAYYEFLCKRAGVRVAYCAEQFENDGSSIATIVKSVKRAMAGEFSRELSVKVSVGQRHLAGLGYRMGGGSRVFGYSSRLVDKDGKRKGLLARGERKSIQTDHVVLEVGPDAEVKTVRQVFGWFVKERLGEGAIAKKLNSSAVTNARGNKWGPTNIHYLLTNEVYAGNNVFNKMSNKLGGDKIRNPPEMWVRKNGAHPALVSASTFKAAQDRIAARPSNNYEDTQMLDQLRDLFKEHKRLSIAIIDTATGVPSSYSYACHFGSLLNAYRLVGFLPKRNCPFSKVNTVIERRFPELAKAVRLETVFDMTSPEGLESYSQALARRYSEKVTELVESKVYSERMLDQNNAAQ